MENNSTTNAEVRPRIALNFTADDLKALLCIKKITRHGHNAEVKEKDGVLVVYDVSKKKAV